MSSIKQIQQHTVHRIQSGQVIVDIGSVVKELIENSLDAGATSIDIRFRNQGLDTIEVQDNGAGVKPEDYEAVALKHYTSKLETYDDISSLHTFGFRGEALSSICALAQLTVTTCRADEVPKGSRLDFEFSGKLKTVTVVAAQRGTTVVVEKLFHNLPVRRRELERNIKREWARVITLLNQYACVQTGVKFTASQQPIKGKRIVLFSTAGNPTVRENVMNIYGARALTSLMPVDVELDLVPTVVSNIQPGNPKPKQQVRVRGLVSRPAHGEGRQAPDRQMFYVNGRPCSLPQFAKVFNEVYRPYNSSQSPFILADIQLDTGLYDVNVSPDKRTILLHDQGAMLEGLREALATLFEGHGYAVHVNTSFTAGLDVKCKPSASTTKHADVPTQPHSPLARRPPPNSSKSDSVSVGDLARADDDEPDSDESVIDSADVGRDDGAENREPLARDVSRAVGARLAARFAVSSSQTGPLNLTSTRTASSSSPPPTGRSVSSAFDAMMHRSRGMRPNNTTQSPSTGTGGRRKLALEPMALPSLPSRRSGTRPGSDSSLRPAPTDGDESDLTDGAVHSRKRLRRSPGPRSLGTPYPFGGITSDDCNDQSCTETAQHNVDTPLPPPDTTVEHSPNNPRSVSVACSDPQPRTPPVEVDRADGSLAHESGSLFAEQPLLTPRGALRPRDLDDDSTIRGRSFMGAHSQERSVADIANTGHTETNNTVPVQPGKSRARAKAKHSPLGLTQEVTTNEAAIGSSFARWKKATESSPPQGVASAIPDLDRADINAGLDVSPGAEDRLTLIISKSDFGRMRVVGQFNLGFILAVKPADACRGSQTDAAAGDQLFIIDQHASDEKYNFERLQAQTTVQSQRLVRSKQLDLTAVEEEIVLNNMDAIEANGFKIDVDDGSTLDSDAEMGGYVAGSRCRLTALPLSKDITFTIDDLEELIHLLGENESLGGPVPRPSKVRRMFAMRACRSSIMIGKALTHGQMVKVVRHMGELDKPWNCPHGRPTMRHLAGMDMWDSKCWKEPRGDELP